MRAVEPAGTSLQSELALLEEAARAAGDIALGFFGQAPESWTKLGDSPVSEADIAVDRYLRDVLTAARPDYGWLSEETGREATDAGRVFVIDPIDGTRAFLDGRRTWCVSVAVVENGRPLAGVLECPARQERYGAARGLGARKNGAAIRVGSPRTPALLAGPRDLVALAEDRRGGARRVPYIPSLAYRLAMIADGQLDATFVRPYSHDWDLAAADLILAEAGGELRNRSGDRPSYGGEDPRHGTLVAGSGGLLDELSAAIAGLDH